MPQLGWIFCKQNHVKKLCPIILYTYWCEVAQTGYASQMVTWNITHCLQENCPVFVLSEKWHHKCSIFIYRHSHIFHTACDMFKYLQVSLCCRFRRHVYIYLNMYDVLYQKRLFIIWQLMIVHDLSQVDKLTKSSSASSEDEEKSKPFFSTFTSSSILQKTSNHH